MPYIKENKKNEIFNENNNSISINHIECAGDLNFAFSIISKNYFNHPNKKNYQAINDIIGALEGAKLEFTRRMTNSYEDSKIKENGDIY